jgi:hypothetical protein
MAHHNFFQRHARHERALIHRAARAVVHLHNPKRVLRGTAKQQVYANRIAGAGASFAASYFAGPVAGEAVAGAFSVGGGYLRTVQARNEGKANDARRLGRSERKRELIVDSIAAGGGALSAAGVTAVGGGSAAQTISAFGGGTQGGQLLYGGSLAPQSAAAIGNPTALAGSVPGASAALPAGGTSAVQAAQAAAVASGATPAGGSAGGVLLGAQVGTTQGALTGTAPTGSGALGGGVAGASGGFSLGSLGGGILSIIPGILKAVLPGPAGGGHALGDQASSGGGDAGSGGGQDSGDGLLQKADGSPTLVGWAGLAVAGYLVYKAVKRG